MRLLYSSATKAGKDAWGRRKENQDVVTGHTNLGDSKNLVLAIADGHGPEGAIVAATIASMLPCAMEHNTLMQDQKYVQLFHTIFSEINTLLSRSKAIDTTLSGCTACMALFPGGDQLAVANLGNCKALLGRTSWDKVEVRVISTTHTPENAMEATRIVEFGGTISPFIYNNTPVGPPRVWLTEAMGTPGLRVTRSFGDDMAHSVGVTCVPDVTISTLMPHDRYLVLASDGLLAFLSDQDVMDMVHQCATVHGMCPRQTSHHLVKEARKRWRAHEEGHMDDVSAIVVFITYESPAEAADGYVSVKARPAGALDRWMPNWKKT